MASVVSLGKIEIIRSEDFMPSKARLKCLKKMIILGPKTAILGLNFVEFWWWGLIFGGCQGIDSFYELLAITELPNNELTSIHTHDLQPLLL